MFLVGSKGAFRAHQEHLLLELRAHQKHVLLELKGWCKCTTLHYFQIAQNFQTNFYRLFLCFFVVLQKPLSDHFSKLFIIKGDPSD